MSKYPKTINFDSEADGGGGQATKSAQGEAWTVDHPSDTFRWYGSITQVKVKICERMPDAIFDHSDGRITISGRPAEIHADGVQHLHDYEPGDGRHSMESDPLCRLCGQRRGQSNHG